MDTQAKVFEQGIDSIFEAPIISVTVTDTDSGDVLYKGDSIYEGTVVYVKAQRGGLKPKSEYRKQKLFTEREKTVVKLELDSLKPYLMKLPAMIAAIYKHVLTGKKVKSVVLELARKHYPEYFTAFSLQQKQKK